MLGKLFDYVNKDDVVKNYVDKIYKYFICIFIEYSNYYIFLYRIVKKDVNIIIFVFLMYLCIVCNLNN